MKKYLIILTLAVCAFNFQSCNYLDIVPEGIMDETAAFRDQYAAEDYLYGCYAFMPRFWQYMTYAQTTELASVKPAWYGPALLGNASASNTNLGAPSNGIMYSFWGTSYGGIRRCYELMANIDGVPRLPEEYKTSYKGEAKFLIAYYHFVLLRAYGAIPIADQLYPLDSTDFPRRSDFDTCLQWISDMFDEAYTELPVTQPDSGYGRATKAAAKAMKAKLWLYAASPLFNGNTEWREWSDRLVDPVEGTPLMPQTYDATKWDKTLQYALEAEREANAIGIMLYDVGSNETITYPNDPTEFKLRMTIIDRNTPEMIWADPRPEGQYDLQNNGAPRYVGYSSASWTMNAPTLSAVKRFYTSRGLPIEEDPEYFDESAYYSIGDYQGAPTANLHLDREPRFYSWISFHNGWFEMTGGPNWVAKWGEGEPTTPGGPRTGSVERIRTLYRYQDYHGRSETEGSTTAQPRSSDYTPTGYLNKKFMHPLNVVNSATVQTFAYPIIRLADLYLIIAEAAVETGDLATAKTYLDKIRVRAGIPTVDEAWEGVATLNQSKLREIVRRERENELYLEGQLIWDNKRWKTMDKLIPPGNGSPWGMNVNGTTDATFFVETQLSSEWKFETPIHYLLPIPNQDINVVENLVQNPGY